MCSMRKVRTETLFLSIAFRTMTITSSIASLRSTELLTRRRFLDVITNTADNVLASVGIPHDTRKRFPDFGPDLAGSSPGSACPRARYSAP